MIALIIFIAFAFPVRGNAGNPGQTCISESTSVRGLDCDASCAPITSLDVKVTNDGRVTICMSCPTWEIGIFEYNTSGGRVLIGSWKAFSGSSYNWSSLLWDQTTYPCLVAVWHFAGSTQCGGGGTYSDNYYYSPCPYTGFTNPWSITDFYPCQ